MQAYLDNTDITLALAFLDAAGAVFVATGAQYRLVDGAGGELAAWSAIPGFVGGSTANLTIAAALNQLAAGEVRDSRSVELKLTNASGTIGQVETYMIEKLDPLQVPFTSFQTYAGAQATAYSISPNLAGWNNASRADRIAALMEARNRLCRLRYRFNRDDQSVVEPDFAASEMELIDEADWASFPDEFKVALQKAQVIQAEHLLSADVFTEIAKHREGGLMSMSVGESSQMFRPGKPLILNVCRAAFDYLGKYISWRKRIAR